MQNDYRAHFLLVWNYEWFLLACLGFLSPVKPNRFYLKAVARNSWSLLYPNVHLEWIFKEFWLCWLKLSLLCWSIRFYFPMYSEASWSAFPALSAGLNFGAWADTSQGVRLSVLLGRQYACKFNFRFLWPAVVSLSATAHLHFPSAQGHCEYISQCELLNVLLLKGQKKSLCYTDGHALPKCSHRDGGMLQHFNVTDVIFT